MIQDSCLFMHYRSVNNDDSINPRGGATIAIHPLNPERAVISIALCTTSDVYNKKLGRNIATGRINAFLSGREVSENLVFEIPVVNDIQLKSLVDEELGGWMEARGLKEVRYQGIR
jgi:hypothetical protein